MKLVIRISLCPNKYRSLLHIECSLRCDVYKRTAAPADAKTRESAVPQLLVANTKTERREVSGGRALVSQLNAVCSFGGQSNFF